MGTNWLERWPHFEYMSCSVVYGIRSIDGTKHGQLSSHTSTVLPVDMQFEILGEYLRFAERSNSHKYRNQPCIKFYGRLRAWKCAGEVLKEIEEDETRFQTFRIPGSVNQGLKNIHAIWQPNSLFQQDGAPHNGIWKFKTSLLKNFPGDELEEEIKYCSCLDIHTFQLLIGIHVKKSIYQSVVRDNDKQKIQITSRPFSMLIL
ncbi:hypothetical protein TNCV_1385661 [Trichonephila clavipes]|nr:hypothetical protein TNCV_1385661 [Trichonephila clavipes]